MVYKMFDPDHTKQPAGSHGRCAGSTSFNRHQGMTPERLQTPDHSRGATDSKTFLSPEWVYAQSPGSCHASSVSSFQPIEPATPPIFGEYVADTFADTSWHMHDWLFKKKFAEQARETSSQDFDLSGTDATTWPAMLQPERSYASHYSSILPEATLVQSPLHNISSTIETTAYVAPTMYYVSEEYAALQSPFPMRSPESMASRLGRLEPSYVSPSLLQSHQLPMHLQNSHAVSWDDMQQHPGVKSEPTADGLLSPFQPIKTESLSETDLSHLAPNIVPSSSNSNRGRMSLNRRASNAEITPKRKQCKAGRQKRTERYAPGRTFKGRPLLVLSEEISATKQHVCHHRGSDGHLCGKSFQRVEHLKRHKQTHDGETFFHCPDPSCKKHDRKFQCRKDNLREHFKTHLSPTDSKRNARRGFDEFYGFIRADFAPEEANKFIEKLENWRNSAQYWKAAEDSRQKSRNVA